MDRSLGISWLAVFKNSQMRAMHDCGCRLSPKQACHQALVKMSGSLLICWGFRIPGLKQAVRRSELLGPLEDIAL